MADANEVCTSDPYRTAAIVETREQRLARLRSIYWAMGAVNVAGRSPEDRAAISRGFLRARDAYLRALEE